MIAAIIQARTNSTRFPNKIFASIEGQPLISHIVKRLSQSKMIEKTVIATSLNDADNYIEEWCNTNNILCFRGSEDNVLERFYQTATKFNIDIIVRITADDPFKDAEIIDEVINLLINEKLDFCCNNNPPTFPEGLDTEVFTFDALKKAYEFAVDPFDLEHVTQYFYRNPGKFKQKNLKNIVNLSSYRWTIDEPEDLEFAKIIYSKLYKVNNYFGYREILKFIEENPNIIEINKSIKRSALYN